MSEHGPKTVLVVDDNPATRYSTRRFLLAAGFDVREAATGQQALDLAKEPPDAVVLDVDLPDMDGFQVCKAMRLRPETARTPIIHLSATFIADDDKAHGLDVGADGYLTHPVEPPVLIATVNAFLRARSAEDQLRQSEQKFRAIFDQAVNGISLMSSDLVYLEVNAAMCRILGRDRSDIVGKPSRLFIPAGYEKRDAEITREVEQHGTWSGTLPLLRADGRLVELDWNISIHSLPGVRLAVVTDITERRAAEIERENLLQSEREARTEAERANRLKDEFLATVSHELRSPLNAIMGWAQLLKLKMPKDSDDYRQGVEAIDRNAKLQAQLISDLLDVSRITSGKMRLDMQPVDLARLTQQSVEGIAHAASAKRITLDAQLPREIRVNGDPGRLQQILANLLTNAVKFTPEGGQIRVTLQQAGAHAELTVADSGQGISVQFLPFIFDTFRQEDAATTRFHEGLGLGLSIVKRLVEMHGGSIAAESEGEGKGSTFRLLLPLAEAPAHTGRTPTPPSEPTGLLQDLRVLIVDDDPDARLIVKRLLVDWRVVVFEAASADDAMAIVREVDPQILISDISMPGADGFDLIRNLRNAGFGGSRLPAIALTAFGRPEDRAKSLANGYQAHLSKPVDLELLRTTIARLAGQVGR